MESPNVIPPDNSAATFDPNLGGKITTSPAFALLTGRYDDLKSSSVSRLHVPITTLPAVLGRTQVEPDVNTYDLGPCKQLSRKHALIFYCDVRGNCLESATDKNKNGSIRVDSDLICKPSDSNVNMDFIRKDGTSIPPDGCFVIECLSKNKIYVDGKRVEQGQRAILKQGSKIRMLTYSLYFLLPIKEEKPKMFTLPQSSDHESISDAVEPALKKIKKDSVPDFLDRPLPELLTEFFEAMDNNTFERKHSFISNTILAHAINDACADESLIAKCKRDGGLQRSEVIDWIEQHETYGRYVKGLLKHLEVKSYHQNLSKAMAKVGFERIGSAGRHVKWLIPGIVVDAKQNDFKETSSETKSKHVYTSETKLIKELMDSEDLDNMKNVPDLGSLKENKKEHLKNNFADATTKTSPTEDRVQDMELEPREIDDSNNDPNKDTLEISMNTTATDQPSNDKEIEPE